ncbi:uncharacterized protein LOC115891702 isoform X2 [Sitophilus oryzae]|uniref:Uncharacterized protein LOC115891702 isoform X2 n=1 Tax=Sitophilus oryzae TaxID=7048 RepID=A0A6J2YXY2_SITOR|nr:uncharacterized protein LOC115891702 isoform X2 [Sitophilus oryzae]
MFIKSVVALCIIGAAWGAPQQKTEFWKGTALDSTYFMDTIKISSNGYENEVSSKRSGDSIEDSIENFIKSKDVTFKVPVIGEVTMDSRKLDDDEMNFKLKFGSEVEERGKKSKLKKVFIPILTFILLKAITVVPFLIGLLALKAWNGLQLSFFSFVIASGLAIFQLCQKLATDSHAPVVLDHPPTYQQRSFDQDASTLAYSAYAQ